MKCIFRGKFLGLLVLGVLVLPACHKAPPPELPTVPHPLTPYQHSLVSGLRASGVSVIKQGEILQIVLPTDRFFRPGTTRLKRHKHSILREVAILVGSYVAVYRQPRITITGYTDTVFGPVTRQTLSLQYAREITENLWRYGLPRRGVRVRGVGAASPIANNETVRGAAYNRRVVVQIN